VPVGAETGGLTAVAVNAEEGQTVQAGQVLVQLNSSLISAQLRQQDASVASAKATLAEANAALNRSRELQAKGYLSPSRPRHRHRQARAPRPPTWPPPRPPAARPPRAWPRPRSARRSAG
jgi:multidrug efflux pump subunit AcrA (membrane-fusion protein)